MKKKLLSVLLACTMVLGLCACGDQAAGTAPEDTADTVQTQAAADTASTDNASSETTAETATVSDQAFGDTIKYDPTVPVNNGEPISIDYWLWTSDELWQSVMDKYMAIHPNVTINTINNPYDDYWVKLPLALEGADGPTLFNMHISYHDSVIKNLAPYDIPLEDIRADFNNVEPHVIDGQVYYLDTGVMTGSIFYNKDMWEAAGLTEADIPETWDEFFEVAKKLTIREDGQLIQAGFEFNNYINSNYLMGIQYQLGQNMFNDDMKTVTINNDAEVKVMQMLLDAYNVYEVGEADFCEDSIVSFATGQTAMVSSWGWLNDYMKANFPDINFGVFQVPVFDKNNIYAYNRSNTESTFGINKNADPAQIAVAQDIVKFLLADNESLLNLALGQSIFPTKKSMANDPALEQNAALYCLKDTVDQYVFPGALPSFFETYLAEAGEEILYNGVDIRTALQTAEDKINADLAGMDFTACEDAYTPRK